MENAQLIGLSRQAALRRQLDVIANNLANVNTAGFKGGDLLFEEYLMPVAGASGFRGDDRTLSYVQDGRPQNNFDPGSIVASGNPFDLAIDGDAFFVLGAPDGDLYSRAGTFRLDADGTLVSGEGHPVLGDAGPIRFTAAETDIHIAGDGSVSSSAGSKGRLRLVRFDQPDLLERAGGTAFAGGEPLPATGSRVVQGAVEQSNVRAVIEITRLIDVTRAYTSLARTLADANQLTSDSIDQLGRLSA